MKYNGNWNTLKELGYRFEKLYANNYIVYSKELFPNFRIWIWKAGREVIVKDWHDNSEDILKIFKSCIPTKSGYLRVKIDNETNEASIDDMLAYKEENGELQLNEEYHNFDHIALHVDSLKTLLNELELIGIIV